MSAECMGWVYRHSPAKGAAFQVHLAAADSANDQHDFELWMRQHRLAEKARVSRRAVGEALAWLCDTGLLEMLESGRLAGSANRYRFLMPDIPVVFDSRGGKHHVHTPLAGGADPGTQEVLGGVSTTCTQNPSDIPRPDPKLSAPPNNGVAVRARDEVWDATMTACGINGNIPPSARGAYNRAVADLKAVGATPDEIARRSSILVDKWGPDKLTPTSLVRHWAEFADAPIRRRSKGTSAALRLLDRAQQEELNA